MTDDEDPRALVIIEAEPPHDPELAELAALCEQRTRYLPNPVWPDRTTKILAVMIAAIFLVRMFWPIAWRDGGWY